MSPDVTAPTVPGPPPPPPGPGVQPPFAAPPTDGTRRRRWLAFGLAGAAVLVVCVGGIFGVGALLVFGSQMVVDQSRAAVTDYLTALEHRDYEAAYAKLCASERQRMDQRAFARSFADDPAIASFSVQDPLIAEDIEVPATVYFTDGSVQSQRYLIDQDTQTAEFLVCGRTG